MRWAVLIYSSRTGYSVYLTPPLEHTREDDGDRQPEQHVNKTAEGVGRDNTEEPEYQKDYEERPEHGDLVVESRGSDI